MEFKRKRLITTDLEAEIRQAEIIAANLEMQEDIYPLNAPGMPPPGPNYTRHASNLGDKGGTLFDITASMIQPSEETAEENEAGDDEETVIDDAELHDLIRRSLREPGFTMPIEIKAGSRQALPFVPGHIWGQHIDEFVSGRPIPVDGPHPADIMVIGKMPGRNELEDMRCLTGETGRILTEILRELHIMGTPKWYVTNLLKFAPPEGVTTIRKPWIKDSLHLLHQELRIVRPKYILCLGADASKALLGTKYSVSYMDGRVQEFSYPINTKPVTDEEELIMHTALVMTVVHPASVSRAPDTRRQLERGLARFGLLISGQRFDKEETDIDHRTIRNTSELRELLYEIEHDPEKRDNWIGMDAEWHGEHPVNKGSYVRTIQMAWRPKHAASIIWHDVNGEPCFKGDDGVSDGRKLGVKLLNDFLKNKRVTGHFFVADLEWLVHIGLHQALKSFAVPLFDRAFDTFPMYLQAQYSTLGFASGDIIPAWARTRFEGGHDTGLAAHAIEETAQLGLEVLTMRYTPVPRYDIPLYEWKDQYCKQRKIKPKDLEGYGPCPDEIIIPYGCLRADSLVQLGDGRWEKISRLVKTRYTGTVKALVKGEIVNASVTNWHAAAVNEKNWFRLQTATTPRGRHGLLGPEFTADHRIITKRGRIRVDKLQPGDLIATDEREFSPQQLSVFVGSLLGDGGFTRQNNKAAGFSFSQCVDRSEYADWKADVFSTHGARRAAGAADSRRYCLPFSRYLASLSARFTCKATAEHRHRKAVITDDLLNCLSDIGLAVWYQDDGCLVSPNGGKQFTSRIYCKISEIEQTRVVRWLTSRFGDGVSYNSNNSFIQITKEAFDSFHAAIRSWLHPCFAYKTVHPVSSAPSIDKQGSVFYEAIDRVVPSAPRTRRGGGVRYCLTVPDAGNFLTKIGFVSNCYDADATLRLAMEQFGLLDSDYNGNCCREPFWEAMITVPAILEMHRNGICIDKQRIDNLTMLFTTARAEQEGLIRNWARWPDFNIRSVIQVREFLFGEEYNGKRDKAGNKVRVRPVEHQNENGETVLAARSLHLKPLLDTSKPPKLWKEIEDKGLEDQHTPGTGKMILGILANEYQDRPEKEQIQWLRDFRFLDQVLKSVLRPPKVDANNQVLFTEAEEGGEIEVDIGAESSAGVANYRDNLGGMIYEAGLASVMCDDGRVRTHLYPTTETGRWRSARPNLQNISKRRDDDYRRILWDHEKKCTKYTQKLRSIFRASPGHVLIEADYKSAELFCMAIMSGDAHLLEHCRRNQLPENHPDYYDIHSNVAVRAFGLNCPPTKSGLKSIGKVSLRVAAKNVIFGVAYGRGAKAIALQCKEEGNPVTVEDAEAIIAAVFEMYPGLVPFFDSCKERVNQYGWMCNCFGRMRRFPLVDDHGLLAEFERQAMNYPIQSMVASAMDRAVAYLKAYRDIELKDPRFFRMLLQIHDAVVVEAPYANAAEVANNILPLCMTDKVQIFPTDLAGKPTGLGPYSLGVDVEVFDHWGEPLTKDFCQANGLPLEFAH